MASCKKRDTNVAPKSPFSKRQAKNKLDQEVEKTLDKSIEAIADEMGIVVRRVLVRRSIGESCQRNARQI